MSSNNSIKKYYLCQKLVKQGSEIETSRMEGYTYEDPID